VRHTFCFTMPANSLYTDSKTASGALSASSINCSNSVGIGEYDNRHLELGIGKNSIRRHFSCYEERKTPLPGDEQWC
jgi:hypothetical protein